MNVRASHYQFMFPFLLKEKLIDDLKLTLLREGFEFFKLREESQGERFYGEQHIRHRKLEKFFLPNIEQMMFPESMEEQKNIRRFTKVTDYSGELSSEFLTMPFHIPSIDIVICPFQIGIMTIRVKLPDDLSFTDSLEFADVFRTLEPLEKEDAAKILSGDHEYSRMRDFVFEELVPSLRHFVAYQDEQASYFGSLPFFMDEKMYVISYVSLDSDHEITHTDLYRTGHLYGYNRKGEERTGPPNPAFLERYYDNSVYDAWADDTYYGVTAYNCYCLTKSDDADLREMMVNEMYGTQYYLIFLCFFYKIVLMKLMHIQSDTNINQDAEQIEDLIVDITEFSSNYFFPEVNTSTFGRNMFEIAMNVFQTERLQSHLLNTLETLYQNHEKLVSKRSNYLLQVLTIYSVISGVLGMNLVVDDVKNGWDWDKVLHFSSIEYIGLFFILSAIVISLAMGYYFVRQYVREYRKFKKKIKKA